MSFTGRYAKAGVSPTSIVSSSLSTSRVRGEDSFPSAALVLLLPLCANSIANVPTEARRARADKLVVIRFLEVNTVLHWFIIWTSLVTLPCLICFLYSIVTIIDDNTKNNAEPMIVASVPPIP